MAYSHDTYPFPMEHQSQANMYFPHQVQYAPYLQQHQPHPEMMFPHHPYSDYTDFMTIGMMTEDYEDGTEVSTRPRLTKEQVEVLEAQFQAHPKPNSMVKKQLAIQTKLTLPRVANWFQNRRAKAKQQRKQEEFEIAQNMGHGNRPKPDDMLEAPESSSKASSPIRQSSPREIRPNSSEARSPNKHKECSQDPGWASLQRALNAGLAAQQNSQDQVQAMLAMPPPDVPRFNNTSTKSQSGSQRTQTSSLSPSSDWSNTRNLNVLTSPQSLTISAPIQDLGFDFGFDQDVSSAGQSNATDDSPDTANQQYIVSSEDWTSSFSGRTGSTSQDIEFVSPTQTSPLPLPNYPPSRRGSGSEELTANLGTFGLTGTPPVAVAPLSQLSTSIRSTDGEIDIASRRKRPRPAALTSAALTTNSMRSRSYGQLTTTSPAFRPGPPSGNALRHVKSTGHSLNSHYAGIRKSSLPQKSPLNLASFAESESLKRLMAQQAAAASSKTPLTTPSRPEVGPNPMTQDLAAQLGLVEDETSMALPSEVLAKFQRFNSPPHTPFQTEYMMQANAASMPPPSARSQYASFAEYTPPYSAGPLTNSTCWSDAPLHSPDVTGFPPGHFMSSLNFAQHDPSIQSWILPSDAANELGLQHISMHDDNKKTEFFITEFPGQKEEYASIAQHILQPRPKNYVFANTAPSDYDG